MCGITALAAAPGAPPVDRARLQRMTDAIAHRGPDAEGLHVAGSVGLGHRRLSIIDVAGGDNPLYDEGRRTALVFNGEIYNHVELRAQLVAAGCRPRSASDGEVILHGYRQWGLVGMLERLRGMYAFALHDLERDELHLGRDPLGIKPLYVALDADGLAAGSEQKAVLAARRAAPALDRAGLLQCATLGFTLGARTMYAGVGSLPPGGWASYRAGRLTQGSHGQPAWEPGTTAADPEVLWERLRESVGSHLMSEVPLGAFLSGGMDSSAVVTAMAELRGRDVDAICVGVLDGGLDERPWARQVARRLGIRLHEEEARVDLAELLPRLAYHLEAPFTDTSAAPTWVVSRAARRHVTVALSGDGGDEHFAGYRRTRFDVAEERWRRRLPSALRRGLLGPLGRAWPNSPRLPRPLRAGTLLRNLADDWLGGWLRSICRVPEPAARALLRPEVQDEAPLREHVAERAAAVEHLDPLHRVLALDLRTWLCDDILVKVDRMSMAHQLEVRVPLLDTAFTAWARRLPGEARLAGGRGKVLLRRAVEPRLPPGQLERPKQGFHLPVAQWLAGPLAEPLRELLSRPGGRVFDCLRPEAARAAFDAHLAGRADRSAELWFVLMLDAWLEHGPRPGGAGP